MAAKPISKELKALRKSAKEFGIDFDAKTTEAELKILVDSAEAAAKAQAEQSGDGSAADASKPGDLTGAPAIPSTGTEDSPLPQADPAPVAEDPEVTADGGTVLQTHKGISLVHFVKTKKADEAFILRNAFGQLLGQFGSREEGLKHMENLTRF